MRPLHGLYLRKCDECGGGMNEGYLADTVYYCSDACLAKHYTAEEWDELSMNGESDYYYYTEWDCWDGEDELYTINGNKVKLTEEVK